VRNRHGRHRRGDCCSAADRGIGGRFQPAQLVGQSIVAPAAQAGIVGRFVSGVATRSPKRDRGRACQLQGGLAPVMKRLDRSFMPLQ
jgi:hypothetical protein